MLQEQSEAPKRDAGLTRSIGTLAFAGTLVNGVIGGGIFAAPAALAGSVGAWAPLALLACGIVMSAIVLCCAECGSRVPSSGGIYAFVDAAYGPLWGFVCGFTLWVSAVLGAAGVAAAFADAVVTLLPLGSPAVQRALILIGVMALIAVANLRGAAVGAGFAGLFTVAKLLPLLLFVGIGLFAIDTANLRPSGAPDPSSFGTAIIVSIFALSGMETVLSASGEVDRPEKTVPRALLLAMSGIVLLYMLIQFVAQGLLGARLGGSAEPLAEAMGAIRPELAIVIAIGAAISRGGWLFSDALGAPRLLFAFARDGILPARIGTLNGRHVPAFAIVLHIVLATALALVGEFGWLVVLSGLFLVPIYAGACLAALKLRRDDVRLLGAPFVAPALRTAAWVGIVSMVALVLVAQWAEIAGLAAVVGFSILVFKLRKPAR